MIPPRKSRNHACARPTVPALLRRNVQETGDVPAYRNARWAALQDCATDRADRKDRCAVGGRDEATAVPISHANEYHRRSSIPTGCFSESLTPTRMSQTERKRVTCASARSVLYCKKFQG